MRLKLMKEFMHKDFLQKFRKTFRFKNDDVNSNKIQHAYYGWDDEAYVFFMFEVLNFLEPRQEEADKIIQHQNDEVTEVIFFEFGTYEVGFEINNLTKFAMRFKEKHTTVINAYSMTFNLRSEWIYKTMNKCRGVSIRRKNWRKILDSHPKIKDELID